MVGRGVGGTDDELKAATMYLVRAFGKVDVNAADARELEAVLEIPTELANAIINQMVVTYRLSKRVGGTPKPYVVNMSGPFSEAGVLLINVQLISPELGTALFDGLIPPPGPAPSSVVDDFVDVLADVEFRGTYSNSGHAFTTGSLTYPIRAFRSLPVTCPAGPGGLPFPYERFPLAPTLGAPDPCGYGGQLLSQLAVPAPPTCCSAASPAGSGC
jgi:hypothetical protein